MDIVGLPNVAGLQLPFVIVTDWFLGDYSSATLKGPKVHLPYVHLFFKSKFGHYLVTQQIRMQ